METINEIRKLISNVINHPYIRSPSSDEYIKSYFNIKDAELGNYYDMIIKCNKNLIEQDFERKREMLKFLSK